MSSARTDFSLDPRLAADTITLVDWPLCRVLLMNDARFPWLILVPRRPDISDIDQLDTDDQAALWRETARAMGALREATTAHKINVGALGNIVRQLHVHVVARRTDDAAWPGPVWGAGTARPFTASEQAALRARLAPALQTAAHAPGHP